jgi:putative oxidoreductase
MVRPLLAGRPRQIAAEEGSMTTENGSNRRVSCGLLALRLGVFTMLALAHGLGKLERFGELHKTFADPLHIGSTASLVLVVFAEFFCSLALVFGLFTRLAAIPVIVNFVVILALVHLHDPWAKKEMALLYLWPAVALLLSGAGDYSLDGLRARRARR